MALFYSERLGCGSCHSGFNFSGAWRDAQGATAEPSFANNGVGISSNASTNASQCRADCTVHA